MRVARQAGAAGAAIVALGAGMLVLCADEASAAPPIVCVRNAGAAAIDVVAGVQAESAARPGVYLGKAKARGGACRYADIDGAMNVHVRRATRRPPGAQYGVIATVGGGWTLCPAQTSADGWYAYTVRRTRAGLVCAVGGEIKDLEGPGDYE